MSTASACSRRADPLARLGAPSTCAAISGFRGRRARIAVEACVEQRSRPRALAAVRNAPDAQARPRPPLRERYSEQALFANLLTRWRRDAAPKFLQAASRCNRTTPTATDMSETSKLGAAADAFWLEARLKQTRQARTHKAADPSVIGLGRRLSSAPEPSTANTPKRALMTKPATISLAIRPPGLQRPALLL